MGLRNSAGTGSSPSEYRGSVSSAMAPSEIIAKSSILEHAICVTFVSITAL